MCGFDEEVRVAQTDVARSMLLIATDEMAAAATRTRMIAERFDGLEPDDRATLVAYARAAEREAQSFAGWAWLKCQPARPLVSEANGSSSS